MIKFIIYGENKKQFIQKVNELDLTVRWQATIVEYKSKRSDIQNNRYWSLMTEFGNFLGYTKDELHEICRYKFLRNFIEIEGEQLPLLKTTTKLTTAEMADYQNEIERWGHEMGYYFES